MNETVKLLKECDSGCKTALDGMEQVLSHISSPALRSEIIDCRKRHGDLEVRCRTLLDRAGEKPGDPPVIGSAMMKAGTEIKLAVNDGDRHIAEMMADGASMGMKSIAKVMNACSGASEQSRVLASDLINEERRFHDSMLRFV